MSWPPCIEHKSVLEPLDRLREFGFEVELVPVTAGGYVEPEAVRAPVAPDTLLVSVMHANNETGVLQPVLEIGELPGGYENPLPRRRGPDIRQRGRRPCGGSSAISCPSAATRSTARRGSVHSTFAACESRQIPLAPLMVGGGQEMGLRPGTLPVPLIVGLGTAAELARQGISRTKRSSREVEEKVPERIARRSIIGSTET